MAQKMMSQEGPHWWPTWGPLFIPRELPVAFPSMAYFKPREFNPISPLSANYLLFQPEETRGALTWHLPSPFSIPSLRVQVRGVKEHLTPSSCCVLRDAPKAIPLRSVILKLPKKTTAFFSDLESSSAGLLSPVWMQALFFGSFCALLSSSSALGLFIRILVREGQVSKLGHEELVQDFNSLGLSGWQALSYHPSGSSCPGRKVAQRKERPMDDGRRHLVRSGLTGVPELAVCKCTFNPLGTRNGKSLCFLLLY